MASINYFKFDLLCLIDQQGHRTLWFCVWKRAKKSQRSFSKRRKFVLSKYPAIIKTLFFPDLCLQAIIARIITENGQWKRKEREKKKISSFSSLCKDWSPSCRHLPNQLRISQHTNRYILMGKLRSQGVKQNKGNSCCQSRLEKRIRSNMEFVNLADLFWELGMMNHSRLPNFRYALRESSFGLTLALHCL